MEDLQALVDAADPGELLLAVDRLCATRDWDALADLARRCRDAVELGRQLWPVAIHIDYRLALEGPAEHAAAVLRPGAGRFALGPLTEVAATTHDWASLAPHLDDRVIRASVAGERALHGEDLVGEAPAAELPLRLQGWEPAYPLPAYRDRSAAFPQPEVATRALGPVEPLPMTERLAGDDAARALVDVVGTWATASAGRVEVAVVEGGTDAAIGALAPAAARGPVTPAEALAVLQWAGASGGAYGARPGGAAGRFAAWWAAAALAGLGWPDGPVDEAIASELARAAGELDWVRWSPPASERGWTLRLAVADPVDGLAWAINASDQREDETDGDDPPTVPSTGEDASRETR